MNTIISFRISMIPHYKKKAKGGEDAAVLTDRLLALADGVGGWAESGIDPAIFARNLCKKYYNIMIAN
jgi:protein phosphatase PTC7